MGQSSGRVMVFDEHLSNTYQYSESTLNEFLGMFDTYTIQCVCSPATGAGNLSCQLEVSSDGRNWANKNSAAEIAAFAVSNTAQTAVAGTDAGGNLSGKQAMGRVRLAFSTAIYGRVKVYVVGRNL